MNTKRLPILLLLVCLIVNAGISFAAITGVNINAVCVGSTITLSDTGSGAWTSRNPAIASIGSITGILTGIAPGIVVIPTLVALLIVSQLL